MIAILTSVFVIFYSVSEHGLFVWYRRPFQLYWGVEGMGSGLIDFSTPNASALKHMLIPEGDSEPLDYPLRVSKTPGTALLLPSAARHRLISTVNFA